MLSEGYKMSLKEAYGAMWVHERACLDSGGVQVGSQKTVIFQLRRDRRHPRLEREQLGTSMGPGNRV